MTNPYVHTGSESPYYDDFDASKNYLKIMYNPSKAVQARELTQSQTILQNQLSALGGYMFKDGKTVSGGKITTSYNQPIMKIKLLDINNTEVNPDILLGKTFIGDTSGEMILITGRVPETRFMLFSYMGAGLVSGENFSATDTADLYFSAETDSYSSAFVAASSEGTLFIDGYFSHISPENITVDVEADAEATYHVGYIIDRLYVTSATDSSLNDPAAGSYNYNAPGADRYQIKVSLFGYKEGDDTITDEIKTKFIPQIIIKGGNILLDQSYDPDSVLMDTLAKRTYEESGSYTVEPWRVVLKDHPSDLSKYIASVQPGLGYVMGYRVNNLTSVDIEILKPRTSISKSHTASYISDGSYTLALIDAATGAISGKGIPDYQKNESVEVMTGLNGSGTVLGTCKITNIYKEGNKVYIYLRNTEQVQNAFPGAKSIRSVANPTILYVNLLIDEYGKATFVANNVPQIVQTPYNMLKEVTIGSLEYESTKTYVATSEVSGNTLILTEADATTDFPNTLGILAIYNTTTGAHLNLNNITAIPDNSGSISVLTVSGAAISNNTSYSVVLRTQRDNIGIRTKVAASGSTSATIAPNVDVVSLAHEDILDVVSITQTSNTTPDTPADLKDLLILNNGQKDFVYDNGSVSGFTALSSTFKANPLLNTSYTITYRYYNHSGSGPFTVNSYVNASNESFLSDIADIYSIIPRYTSNGITYTLRDALDFRVKRSVLDSVGAQYPSYRTEVEYASEVYLPRLDYIWVDKNGVFGSTLGISSEKPALPNLKTDALQLYVLNNSPYVNRISDVSTVYINHLRHTMNDINKLATRVTSLEDVVSLTQLEQQAINMQILDEAGNNRYKSGIFTDDFSSFDNSNFIDENYTCTIDEVEQSIRPDFNSLAVDFEFSESDSVAVTKSDISVHLPYTTEVYTSNMKSSETTNVQKLLFYVWNGALKLVPSVDNWVTDLGDIIISEKYIDTPRPPTTYRSWSTSSVRGFTTTTTSYRSANILQSYYAVSDKSVARGSTDEFMRQRSVQYICTGMRPGIPVTAFIDSFQLVLSNNTPASDGTMTGTFTIPANVPVGTKVVRLQDSEKTSSAATNYTASGRTVWDEVDRTYIRQWVDTGRQGPTEITGVSRVTTRAERDENGGGNDDPIAQTIYVTESTGVYIDSIDVFFKTKDANLGVRLYVVECDNGYPSNVMLPFSRVDKTPAQVIVAGNEDKPINATNFKFEVPVYLSPYTEYAFVVATDSYQYTVYTSTLGKADLITGIGIAEQPHLGSMFLSQNSRTWTAEQLSDVTFRVYRCKFNPSTVGHAVFKVPAITSDFEVAMMTLASNVFTPSGSSVKTEYKWRNDLGWTEYNNLSDIFNSSLQMLDGVAAALPSSLDIRFTLYTESEFLTPLIDTEQVYGIFTNNKLTETGDVNFIYNGGSYISNAVTLTNPANDIRIIHDVIAPGRSDVDVYFKTTDYQPVYVQHASAGVAIDSAAGEVLDGQQCQIFYYNNSTSNLEPKSSVIVTGYSATDKHIYLRSVGNPDEFFSIQDGDASETIYDGLAANYTAILILPISSSVNISCPGWTSSVYSAGQYVTYSGYIWRARTIALAANTPSDLSIIWEKIHALKTVSVLSLEDVIVWRKMKRDSINTNVDSENSFVEYSYYPEIDVETEFKSFAIKIDLKSRNKVDVPRVKNLRAIATV